MLGRCQLAQLLLLAGNTGSQLLGCHACCHLGECSRLQGGAGKARDLCMRSQHQQLTGLSVSCSLCNQQRPGDRKHVVIKQADKYHNIVELKSLPTVAS